MSDDRCAEIRLKLQADLDGELDAAEAAAVAAHTLTCPACTEMMARLGGLSSRLRAEAPRHAAPAALRQNVERLIAARAPAPAAMPAAAPAARPPWFRRVFGGARERLRLGASFGAGFAIAAGLALFVLLPRGGDMADDVVASHIRALQPGHLMDVASTDQHTVKPWFDGRLDFSPPVKGFAAQGFPLLGGRLDYLDGRPVAALSYGRAKHIIDVYVWPLAGGVLPSRWSGEDKGYNVERWAQDGMQFWAVSDVERSQLADFVALWRAGG